MQQFYRYNPEVEVMGGKRKVMGTKRKTGTKGTMDSEGACLLPYSTMPTVSPACRLCINIHHYAPPRIVLQQAAAIHAVRREYSSVSSFKSIT